MTYYFDPNHPQKLIQALSLVYGMAKGQPDSFKIYDSEEYGNAQQGSVFFIVDEEKDGLEINTRRLAEDGNVVVALKFPPGKRYVPFEIAEAILKMWGRVLTYLSEGVGAKIYKYHWKSDQLRPVD